MKQKTKMIKVNEDTHAKFKKAAKNKGMKFDAFVNLILKDHAKIEVTRG